MAKNTFNIFLVKTNAPDFRHTLTQSAIEKLAEDQSFEHFIEDFADGASLYIFIGRALPPKWLRQINTRFGLEAIINTRSASGILFFKVAERIFAATFGHGWMHLNAEFLENDFGLRASINAIDEAKLNRLDRTNLGDALRGSALSPFKRTFTSFGIDDALELVRKIGGSTKSDVVGDSMVGAKSLKVSGDIDFDDLPKLGCGLI